jgi:hypothetical protein
LLASPVVGEFKGWFSNLFGLKQQGTTGILYSADDICVTRGEVGKFLQGLGVFVQGPGFSQPLVSSEEMVLRCQVDEANPISSAHLNSKAVTFRVELRTPGSTPLDRSPHVGDYLSAKRSPGNALRSPLASPLPSPLSPNLNAFASGPEFPPGCLTAIIVVHEKGSMTTFRAVWKHMKGAYGDIVAGGNTSYVCQSPMIGSNTPITEQPQRFTMA